MSWILGVVGQIQEDLKRIISTISDPLINVHEEKNLYLLSGGSKSTQVADFNSEDGFIVVGNGIAPDEKKKFMSSDDWKRLFEKRADIYKLDGHFALVTWNKNNILFQTDITGLRDIYLYRLSSDTILFSTRVDWLQKLSDAELDFQKFGSRWLLFSQITTESVFKNVIRLVAGKSATINRQTLEIKLNEYNWLPDSNEIADVELLFESELKSVTTFPLFQNNVSLSLSGGLDSRVLFSILLNTHEKKWDVHSFGLVNHPDSQIAKEISQTFGIEHRQFYNPNADNLIAELEKYLLQTIINTSALSYLQLRHYSLLNETQNIIIDGAFGEIYRKEFLKKLRILGFVPIKEKNIDRLYELFLSPKPDFFSNDIKKIMIEGARIQIEELIDNLPGIEDIGINNYSNLLAIKTKLPNHFCCEQSRIDDIVKSYMPYVQPSILKYSFSINTPGKNIFKKIIKRQRSELRRFPLVKGETVYPYYLNGIGMNIYKRLKEKFFRHSFRNEYIAIFKKLLLPYLIELVETNQLYNPDIYNKNILRNYLKRANDEAGIKTIIFLDWFLCFEIFYRQIKSSSLNIVKKK
ncbi:asparagine synthase-related protein [Melioribacter sp. Ez-97]|uniref:asparagine synthase-related protein n=1 Tax=Melioribacter sp. Ez-97 TaxID=3423434 RepID=UPI003ED9B55B